MQEFKIPTKNTLAVDVKSKGGSQDLCRNAVDHIKNLIMMAKTPQCFVAWVIIIKNFNVINSIPAQALAAPF